MLEAGGWGHCLSACSMLGAREREIQKMEGGEKAKCRREISSARALCVASGSLRY